MATKFGTKWAITRLASEKYDVARPTLLNT